MRFQPVTAVVTPICSKLGYKTRGEAVVARRAIEARRDHCGLHIYRCQWCDYFHLGRDLKKR